MADSEKKEPTEVEKTNRKAWRALLVTSVGSAAFLAAAMSNIIKTHQKHGWPKNAFKKTDYVLMTVPKKISVPHIEKSISCFGTIFARRSKW